MEINSAFSSGVNSLNKASEQVTESSQRIANQTPSDQTESTNPEGASEYQYSYASGPVTTELINLKLAELQAQSAAKVITTADDMVGSLIDVSV